MKITMTVVMAVAAAMLFPSVHSMAKTSRMSDEQIKEKIVQASIFSYPGNCPCPYHSARNGSQCGKRSAWNRAGGYSPICYKSEVTKKMVDDWRKQNSNTLYLPGE